MTTSLARGASDEWDTAVALPLTVVSSQNVIGSFEARFFARRPDFLAAQAGPTFTIETSRGDQRRRKVSRAAR
jgi:hypothetical protein